MNNIKTPLEIAGLPTEKYTKLAARSILPPPLPTSSFVLAPLLFPSEPRVALPSGTTTYT